MADNKENRILNVPPLRFPEFSGEWEEHTLRDVVTFSNGKAHENCVNDDGDYILVNSKFVSTNGQVQKRVTSQLSPLRKSQFVMVMSDLPNGKALAKCFYVEDDNKYTLNQRICSFTSNDGNVSRFLMYQINRNKYYMRFDDGINQTNLKKSEVLSCPVFIPTIREQEKIATLLRLIDERIATQNKVIEKLESLIKGITDELLYNLCWEKVYLRSFMEFYPTNSFSWEQLSYEKGIIRNLHYGVIHSISTKSVATNTLPFISSNKIDSRFVWCQNGDVAFADASEDTADIGKAVEFTDVDNTNVVCGLHTIHGRDIKGLTVTGFKGFIFNSSYFHKQVRRVAQGTKVFSISSSNLSSCYVYIPDKSEQTKITGLLRAMEMKLSLTRKLLERYKTQKEYLLRQMFI